ncbi:glycoside hydrolase family 35 protein [Guyanagaster necrorhizus]|uniref:beta-galactosidase n=1 Tax=Guyanagaster necrorhizus TaxID=856835 RepID=A0A9P7VG35_9AGAR|nr:glycoside hydrolase family 35 protein [Guyanagaster necrorhizus MCA 3950]KAG7440311.1 glycoside hydrolase family 35 protein [Guyanagaster necrorhizus MCA 3950]
MNISSDFRSTPTDLFRRWTAALLFWSWLSVLLYGNSVGALARSIVHDDTLHRRVASFTDQVSFDNYSLSLRGQRIFLHSGEFHTFRLPVPSLWPDILQKVKASGLNAVSVYVHMGLLNPSRGVVDFDGFRALKPLYEAALDAGIWIVLRPGYINAETSAGGIAHWATSEVAGTLRTSAPDWKEAWMDYILGIIEETAPYQITEGGPVIGERVAVLTHNEFTQSIGGEYFAELEEVYRNSSIALPLTYNDPGEGRNFINGTGAVDLYGLDSYPQGFDCSHPLDWNGVTLNYHQYHEAANPSQPWYFPEFQGGSFDAWGPTAPGYALCAALTGPDFMSVFYLQLWASNAKLTSYYMLYGGTSWGAIPFHANFGKVYTSYDYGASIDEARQLTTKYDELKRQCLFIRSSPEFHKTDWIADSSTGLSILSSEAVFATYLLNPDTQAGFYIVRHTNSTSTDITDFKINVATVEGDLQIPIIASAVTLGGRQSKVIVSNYAFGSSRLLYSTAPIYFAGVIDGRDVLFIYGDASQEHEIALSLTGRSFRKQYDTSSFRATLTPSSVITIFSFPTGTQGLVTVYDSDSQLVLFADSDTVATFWAPVIPGDANSSLRNYWGLGTNESVLVGGPYLVRSASISGTVLALKGDLNASTPLTIIAPAVISSVTWNGVALSVHASSSLTEIGGLIGDLSMSSASVDFAVAPTLEGWKFRDSLPEIQPTFDDGSFVVANHTTTNIPLKPYYSDGTILYGCDYGFCENIVLWRGHFNGTGAEKSVNLSINGGEAFAASVWLNNIFLNTSYGNSTNNKNILEETDDVFIFPEGAVLPGDNIITVVQDNMGLNETSGSACLSNTNASKSPRGIRGFQLNTGKFTQWRVQGKIGGYTDFPDKTRGVFNEGGLYGERKGWHLPGFDTSSWKSRDLNDGLPESAAGVGFFVTTFDLDIPEGFDVPMSFNFNEPLGQPYRVYLFVNGWMMGKRVGNLGQSRPQAKFPVHQGILDYSGTNTVAVALWAMEANTTIAPDLQLSVDAVYKGGPGGIVTNNPRWSPAGRV